MRNRLIVLFLGLSSFVFAQQIQEDVLYEYVKGKKYIVHIAQAGNTLWGLHTKYNAEVEAIVATNPGVDKGVQEGNKYLIPFGEAEAKYPDGTQLLAHYIVKGETSYSISKKYNASLEQLNKLNPGIEKGTKIGQLIQIPISSNNAAPVVTESVVKPVKSTVSFSDSIVTIVVKEKETLYSISKRFLVPVNELQSFNQLKNSAIKPGDILRIPLKKETIKQVEIRAVEPLKPIRKVDDDLLFKKKQLVRVAILLPFGLDESEPNTTLKSLATEFYMGVELAADSLSRMGIDATFQIFDVPMDTLRLLAILKKPELKQMDLIIGPFSPQGADIVGKWCKANKIRMVCPSSVNSSILKGNPYVYAAVSSDITQQRILAKHAIKTFKNDQIFLVNTGISRDKELLDAFRSRFLELSKTNGNIKLTEIKAADVGTYIKKNANTIFVVPTRDKVAATRLMNAIHKSNAKAGTGSITVLGTKEWAGFDDISGFFRNKYAIQWAASSDLNYLLPETQSLLRLYRSKFKADMNRIGAHGFDITHFFVQTLLQQETITAGVMNAFEMEQVEQGSGFENNQCFIMKHVDYVLVREEILHE